MKTLVKQPVVSVLISVCNDEKFLQKALESLFLQSYPNFEIIAIDDKSIDQSFSILNNLKRKDRRLFVFQNVKRYGKMVTLNRALRRAKGRFVAFMNAADVCYKDKLREQVAYLLTHDKSVAIGSQHYILDERGRRIDETHFPESAQEIYKKPFDGVSLQFEGVMIDRHRIPKDVLHFHTPKLAFLYSDILVKLLQFGAIGNLPQKLYGHRTSLAVKDITAKQEFALQTRQWLRSITLFDHRPSFKTMFLSGLLRIRVS